MTPAAEGREPAYGSDHIVSLLEQLGIEYVAFNPGATFRGIHDSLVNFAPGAGPAIVQCLHEEIAVAVAHGYAKATGRPMAVALHDVVGLQHAAMAIYNAWCDRVPMLLIGGTGPLDAAKRRPWIDWTHTANTQATQVRDYTKWDDQPMSLEAVDESLVRAMQLTCAKPSGPVYVNIDSLIQEQEVPLGFAPGDLGSYASPTPPMPQPSAVEELGTWLEHARRPVIVADYVGRDAEAFSSLVELSELMDIPVVDREGPYNKLSLNFPTQHPHNGAGFEDVLFGEADVIVGLETRDLHGVLHRVGDDRQPIARHRPEAKVALVSLSHLVTNAWTADFQRLQPTDLHVTSDSASVLKLLLSRFRAAASDGEAATVRRRRMRELSESFRERRREWRATADDSADLRPVVWSYLARVLDEETRGADRVIANGHLGNWMHRLWDLDHPDQYHGDAGGAGLGYGLGASIGVALASRGTDRIVIDVQSDGDALYTPSALWTAAHYELPLLIVMDNNRAYNNTMEHAMRLARMRGRPEENKHIGTAITEPAVDFAKLAESFGIYAEGPIEDPSALGPALARATKIVREERRPALVDVVTARSWWTTAQR